MSTRLNQLTLMPSRFEPPTLSACLLHAAKIELPDREAMAFFAWYDSVDWFVGKKKMVRWHSAMAGWKFRWEEKQRAKGQISPSVQMIRDQNELQRVEDKMRAIKQSYDGHVEWSAEDRQRYKQLKDRKAQLLKLLGMAV